MRWAYCPGCGRRRERRVRERALCVRCQVGAELDKAYGGQSVRAAVLVRAAHKHTSWEEFTVGRDSAVVLAAAIAKTARELCPGDGVELEWEWDDAADRPTGRGRLRLSPATWRPGQSPASVLGAALADDEH